MMLLIGSWVLASFAFVLGWGIRSAMIGNRRPRKVRRARSRVMRVGQLGLFTTLAGKLMVSGVALAAVGGLAVEGSLPRPVQKVVSAAAERVGLQIPSGGDEDELRVAASNESEGPPVIRRRVLDVIDNWEGEKDCEYLRALVQAAGATPPARCPGEDGGAKSASNQGSLGPVVVIPEPTTAEPTPPTSASPSAEPSPSEPVPSEPPLTEPPAEPPPAEPPPSEPPSAEPPSGEPPLVQPPTGEPPLVQPPTGEPPLVQPPTGEPPLVQPPLTEPPTESTRIEPTP